MKFTDDEVYILIKSLSDRQCTLEGRPGVYAGNAELEKKEVDKLLTRFTKVFQKRNQLTGGQ